MIHADDVLVIYHCKHYAGIYFINNDTSARVYKAYKMCLKVISAFLFSSAKIYLQRVYGPGRSKCNKVVKINRMFDYSFVINQSRQRNHKLKNTAGKIGKTRVTKS